MLLHDGGFVVIVGAVVTAHDQGAHFAGVIQFRGRFDAGVKVEIAPAPGDRRRVALNDRHRLLRQFFAVGGAFRSSVSRDPRLCGRL